MKKSIKKQTDGKYDFRANGDIYLVDRKFKSSVWSFVGRMNEDGELELDEPYTIKNILSDLRWQISNPHLSNWPEDEDWREWRSLL